MTAAAFDCEICNAPNAPWRIERTGDAVISWADSEHLARVCLRLQRVSERTELTVSLSAAAAPS